MRVFTPPEKPSVTLASAAGLAALLFVAVLIIPHMTDFSMWFDEVNMVDNALTLDMGENYRIERQAYAAHPPLYFVLIRVWALLAGDSDLALRVLSVLPMILGAGFVFRITTDFSRQVFGGIAATSILGAAGFFQTYAHTTHNYGILLMLVAALLFFYERWRLLGRRVYAVGIVVSTVLLLYAHYYGAYVVIAFNLHALGMHRRAAYWRWIGLQAISAVCFLPWLPVLLRLAGGDYDRFGDHDRLLVNTLPTNWNAIEETFHSFLFDGVALYGALIALGLAALVIRARGSYRSAFRVIWLLVLLMVVSLGIALLINLRLQSYLPRRAFYLLALFVILIGYLLAHLPRGFRWGVLVVFLALTWNDSLPEGWAGNWYFRQGLEAVAEDAQPGDLVLINFSGEFEMVPFQYYARRVLPPEVPFAMQTDNAATIANLAYPRARLWVIWGDNAPPVFGGELADKHYTEIDKQRIGWLNISLYEASPQPRETLPQTARISQKLPLPQVFADRIDLLDYQLDTLEVDPGGSVTLWLDWRATRPLDQDYGIYVHLLDAETGELAAQADSGPSHLGRSLPTPFWVTDQPVYDRHSLTISANTPPGLYDIRIGMYSYVTSERLPINASDGLTLARIEVR